MLKPASLGFFAAMALLQAGCITFNGNRAIVPFFEIYDQAARPAGPGKTLRSGPGDPQAPSREYVFRPFGSLESIGEGERHRIKALWPFGDFAWGGGDQRHWLLPLFYYRNRPLADAEGSDFDWMLFPFLFGGSDPTEGSYFAFFPIAGKLRGLLAKDETHFFLFPLYWRWWEKDYDSMHLVWPFFNRVQGGGYAGWRILPFYGHYTSFKPEDGSPRFEKSFIFWPFYIHQFTNLNSERPTETYFSFPFYGQSINPHTVSRSYLFLLFNTARDARTDNTLYFGYFFPYRFTGGQFDPWPFFGWKTRTLGPSIGAWDNRDIYPPRREVAPLTDPAESGDWFDLLSGPRLGSADAAAPPRIRTRFRQFAIWPIERYDTAVGDTWEESRFWLLPLFWRFHTLDKDTQETTSEWKFWPFCRYRREGGRTTFYLPSPIWFRQENPFERQYARLWRLFLYEENDERSGWELAFGFLSRRYEKAAETSILSLFYGLLEWESGPGGHGLRIFYLPWK